MTWAGDWLDGEPTEDNESDETRSAPVDDTAPPLVPGSETEARSMRYPSQKMH